MKSPFALAAALLFVASPVFGQMRIETQRPGLLGCLVGGRTTAVTITAPPSGRITWPDIIDFQMDLARLQALEQIASNTAAIRGELCRVDDNLDENLRAIRDTIENRAGLQPVNLPSSATPMGPQVYCPDGTCPTAQTQPRTNPRVYAPRTIDGKPRATVRVRSTLRNHNRIGSGCHIGKGLILSCAHILRHGWACSIETTDGRRFRARILRADALRDLSLLKVEDPDFDACYVPLSQTDPQPGVAVNMSGMSRGWRLWRGRTIGYFGPDLQVVGPAAENGDSGGPIVAGGKVVSVINEYVPSDRMTSGPCVRDINRFLTDAGIDPPK